MNRQTDKPSNRTTDGEALRRLANDRDYWRRKAEALERKYKPIEGRCAIALLAKARIINGRETWTVDTIWIEDARDCVRNQRALRGVMDELEASFAARAKGVANAE